MKITLVKPTTKIFRGKPSIEERVEVSLDEVRELASRDDSLYSAIGIDRSDTTHLFGWSPLSKIIDYIKSGNYHEINISLFYSPIKPMLI